MKLDNKKDLASRALQVGKGRIVFNNERLAEIKEAITKADIKQLVLDKAIVVREIKGSRKHVARKTRRRAGSFRKKVINGKTKYVILTRKLRKYLAELKKQEVLSNEHYHKLRKEIRAKNFRDKAHIKERIIALKGKAK